MTDSILMQYLDANHLYNTEGRRGVSNLCTTVAAMGYKDETYYGQLSEKAYLGDLLMFLEDNPGAIESMYNWIQDNMQPEWTENLSLDLVESGETVEGCI